MKKPNVVIPRLDDIAGIVISPLILPTIIGITALGLLGYHLLRLVPFGPNEQAQHLGSATMSAIKNDISFGPLKGAQITLLKITENDIYMRLASVAVALVAALILYAMLRKWYTARVSFLTSIMFITSSWFLHQGRLVNLDVLYLITAPAVLVAFMLLISKRNSRKLPIVAILLALTLYTPGTWPFIIFVAVVLRKHIISALKVISRKVKLISAGLFLVILAPLVYSFVVKSEQIVRWLGLDIHQTFSAHAIGSHLLAIPKQLLYHGPADAGIWLVGTPVFDIMTTALIVLGSYAYVTGHYASRQTLVFGMLIIAVILIGIGNVTTLSLLIPVLYLVVANGIAYMLQSWFTVFPRNPVARPIGLAILCIVIAGSCFYQLNRYFVAWPHAANTRQALLSER